VAVGVGVYVGDGVRVGDGEGVRDGVGVTVEVGDGVGDVDGHAPRVSPWFEIWADTALLLTEIVTQLLRSEPV